MSAILDGVLPLVGVLGGFVLGRRERNLRQSITYRCECTHSLSMHRSDDGRCKADSGHCSCQQYVGLRPMEELT